jgi:hypothetical protein
MAELAVEALQVAMALVPSQPVAEVEMAVAVVLVARAPGEAEGHRMRSSRRRTR